MCDMSQAHFDWMEIYVSTPIKFLKRKGQAETNQSEFEIHEQWIPVRYPFRNLMGVGTSKYKAKDIKIELESLILVFTVLSSNLRTCHNGPVLQQPSVNESIACRRHPKSGV